MKFRSYHVIIGLLVLASISAPRQALAQWLGWENLGGVLLEEPDCTTWSTNRIDCFARGTDAAMYHRWWNGSSWNGWENLGGVILEAPDCVSWGANRIDCFARGTDRAMYHRWWNGAAWGGWENLGGVILDKPSCVSWGLNRIDCFARGTDAAMYHRWWNGSNWGGWENLGGVLLDRPECVSWGSNRIDCFARGTDRAMYHRWWNGSSWGGWENLGGAILETPECVSWGSNRIDCFARGTDRAMYHRWWNGSAWGGWENLGGVILERAECTTWSANRIDCFARGTDAAMYHRWWNGSAWGGWENLGGVILEQPECLSWGPDRIDCFARGTDRAMYHRWYNSIVSRSLTISRHNTATLSNANADTILGAASSLLQSNDGAGDIACGAGLSRSGTVGVFNDTDGSLDTANELSTIFGLAGNVKVVQDVNFCGGVFKTSFIGCGQTPGSSFITERFTASQEDSLWAHEYGHNQGLPHRNTSSDNLMNQFVGGRRVNQSECTTFRGGSPSSMLLGAETLPSAETAASVAAAFMADRTGEMPAEPLSLLVQAAGDTSGESDASGMPLEDQMEAEIVPQTPMDGAPDDQLPPVEEFVTRIYYEGLPMAEAARYGEDAIPILARILADPSMAAYHDNAATTLGMIGEAEAVQPLIAYLEGELGSDADAPVGTDEAASLHRGRVGAVVALGYLGNLADSDEAVDYLIAHSTPDAWSDGKELAAGATPDDGLAKYAIIGLGFTGDARAEEFLRSLGSGATPLANTEGAEDVVDQSLSILDEVSDEGLLGYYADR